MTTWNSSWNSPGKILEWNTCPPPGNLPNSGTESRSPALHADSLPTEPPEKPNPCCSLLLILHSLFITEYYSIVWTCHYQLIMGILIVSTFQLIWLMLISILVYTSFHLLSHVRLFVTPWTTARQASLSITNSWSPFKPMSIELVMTSNHLILCHPLLLLPSIFPSIGAFSNELLRVP